jgi:hypothetical protein
MRIYVIPSSPAEKRVLDMLHVYGIKSELQTDRKGVFYDVTPPDYWQVSRRVAFQRALEQCTRGLKRELGPQKDDSDR